MQRSFATAIPLINICAGINKFPYSGIITNSGCFKNIHAI